MREREKISHSTPSLSEIEKKLGIERYITSADGIGGRIKEEEKEFLVEEISDISISNSGKFAIIRVEKKNWDTLNLVRVLSNALGISRNRIGFAGTKDKKALAIQYFSISKADEKILEKLLRIKLRDVKIELLGFSNKGLKLGDLIGNRFTVVISDVRNGEKIGEIVSELESKGIPNYFGIQRFGTLRFITHEVGKQIILRNYSEAFWIYVSKPSVYESEDVRKIREDLWNERDPRIGLRELPKYLVYERSLLQKVREGKDELKALLSLPKNLKLMFIHAYQSYLFNRLLSERIREFKSLREVNEGDVVDFIKREGEYVVNSEEFKGVNKTNLARIEFLIQNGYAYLSLPLIGYEIKLSGWNAEKMKEILEEEGIEPENFKGEYPEFSSKGYYRCAEIPFDFSKFEFEKEDNAKALFRFFLPKGSFATIFLREFMKSDYPHFL